MHLFEYAVIRVMPRVEREEFINVGVIVYCRSLGFLKTLYTLNETRLHALSADLDIDEVRERIQAFEKICAGRRHHRPARYRRAFPLAYGHTKHHRPIVAGTSRPVYRRGRNPDEAV